MTFFFLLDRRYEPYLWENEKQSYKRYAVLFGFFVQLNRMHTDVVQKLPTKSNTESNILRGFTVPRFKYLPIRFHPCCPIRGLCSLWQLFLCSQSSLLSLAGSIHCLPSVRKLRNIMRVFLWVFFPSSSHPHLSLSLF